MTIRRYVMKKGARWVGINLRIARETTDPDYPGDLLFKVLNTGRTLRAPAGQWFELPEES